METVDQLKKKIKVKKARLQRQEILMQIKERKARTRHLIEIGSIASKSKIDHLSKEMLLGAFLSLGEQIDKDSNIVFQWERKGKDLLQKEAKDKTPVILTFTDMPDLNLRKKVRSHGLKWNALRKEWYGYIADIDLLKEELKDQTFSLQDLSDKEEGKIS